jgi:hypothetical protein
MAIFNRSVNKAAISPQPTKAAAAGSGYYSKSKTLAQTQSVSITTYVEGDGT